MFISEELNNNSIQTIFHLTNKKNKNRMHQDKDYLVLQIKKDNKVLHYKNNLHKALVLVPQLFQITLIEFMFTSQMNKNGVKRLQKVVYLQSVFFINLFMKHLIYLCMVDKQQKKKC